MKRLALSLLAGCLIPFIYAIIAAPLSTYITNPTLDRLLMYPVRWPILILFRLGYLPFDNEVALIVYVVVGNVSVYSVLSYFLLWRFSRRKCTQALPPEPPSFVPDSK
jgi:hypothetical protein